MRHAGMVIDTAKGDTATRRDLIPRSRVEVMSIHR